MNRKLQQKYIALTTGFILLASLLIFIFTKDTTALTMGEITFGACLMNAGIVIFGISVYHWAAIEQKGLESISSADRKQIKKAFARNRLPADERLHKYARAYARQQRSIARLYILPGIFIGIGGFVFLIGNNYLLRSEEYGISRFLSPANTVYFIYPLIGYVKQRSLISRNAELLANDNSEALDDDPRWWTGRW